ncbi:MAG: tetratricopeptide repeat protein [Gemmatimonadetes bacterium]|nr:tetratricopeptide repeat protein [Gemmatimonadota bacterium]NNK63110.1 tetratricopeptide repeat protein [Gemmatimonadota bacterium]
MTLTPDAAATLLREARALDEARSYPELGALLSPWDEEALGIEPELLFLRADVGRRLGRGEDAVRDLDALESRIARFGNVALRRRRLNLLGSLRFESGDIDGARDLWLTQLDDSTAAGDEQFAARACNNLGVVATLLDELPSALAYYARAVASYFKVGYERGLGQSHHNLGITYREMGFLHEADSHFRTADRLARSASSDDEVARVAQERALLLYLLGDADLARHTARLALEIHERLEDPAGSAEVHRVLGLVDLGEGDIDAAEAALEQALATAHEISAILLKAEILAARAALRSLQDREIEAQDDDAQAAALFEAIGAPAWGRRARDRARSMAARGGARM